ncbi:MAG TPA: hypothetical protein VFC46_02700 [Humisphaera sp.]|nr:hypothetical protein [Humisphaera sp.]
MDFYLGRLEVAASLLAEVITARAPGSDDYRLDSWTLFENLQFCVNQINGFRDSGQAGRIDATLWSLFDATFHSLRGWSTDGTIAIHAAKILFVSSSAIRRLYELPSPAEPLGVDRWLRVCVQSLPFPFPEFEELTGRPEITAQNLQWLCDKVKDERR